jgi:hypothetical protein
LVHGHHAHRQPAHIAALDLADSEFKPLIDIVEWDAHSPHLHSLRDLLAVVLPDRVHVGQVVVDLDVLAELGGQRQV